MRSFTGACTEACPLRPIHGFSEAYQGGGEMGSAPVLELHEYYAVTCNDMKFDDST